MQVRQSDGPGRFKWKLLKKGETINLSKEVGLRYGLKKMKTTEGQIGQTKVETKQLESPNFQKELESINGIGKKTAKDITKVFPTEEKLKEAIKNKEQLAFRDDVEIKLREKYE